MAEVNFRLRPRSAKALYLEALDLGGPGFGDADGRSPVYSEAAV